MGIACLSHSDPMIALFAPPYDGFQPITTSWSAPSIPPRGLALVWWLRDGAAQEEQFQWLYDRPRGLPLFLVLPPAKEIARTMPLLEYVTELNPHSVLPSGKLTTPAHLRELLCRPPRQLASAVTTYLVRRNLLTTDEVRREVQRLLECIPEVRSISKLARRLYTSRRTLGRHFSAVGLPVPSHWLQFGRLLYVVLHLQSDPAAVFRIASRAGYPDGFTMSNQMKRLLGCRPTEVRSHLGWEWVIEAWIRQEARTGGIDSFRYGKAVGMYLDDAPTGRARISDAQFPHPRLHLGSHSKTSGSEKRP